MIEVLDIKDAEPNKLDITPELALAAYNTLIQFCKQQEGMILCSRCVLHNSCPAITDRPSTRGVGRNPLSQNDE